MILPKTPKQKVVRGTVKSGEAMVVARAFQVSPEKTRLLAKLIRDEGVKRAVSKFGIFGVGLEKAERNTAASSVGKAERFVTRVSGRKDKKSPWGVAFGSVIIEGQPSKVNSALVKHNIEVGRAALARAGTAFVEPGVKLGIAKNIPRYHVDLERPGFLIREVDGHRERVNFINGEFVVAA